MNKPIDIAADLDTPSDLSVPATTAISAALNTILADAFALYLKTKNFHWHVSGHNFRDYHLLFDEQADAIFATTDQLAEQDLVPPKEMLRVLMDDNKAVATAMRKTHKLCDDYEDLATASLLENFIDETERRIWFLFEASRHSSGNAE